VRDERGRIREERPFREILALCAMSGTPGFPCLYKRGCARFPSAWAPDGGPADTVVCPYVVMSIAPGATLSALDLRGLKPELSLGIALQLLRLLLTAERKLGAGFQHFDLHPDNIFVDVATCAPTSIVEGMRISCPSVTLIDFDLVAAPAAFAAPAFQAELPEQLAKRTGAQPVPERTIAFATKWLPPSRAAALVASVRAVPNTDMRNWLVITHVLLTRLLPQGAAAPELRGCASARDCVARYNDVFEPLFRVTRRRGAAAAGDDDAGAAMDLVAMVPFQADLMYSILGVVASKPDWVSKWEEFDAAVVRSEGVHPTYDSTQLLAYCSTPSPHSVRMQTSAWVVATATFGGVELAVSAPALAPRLEVHFKPALRIQVLEWPRLREVASQLLFSLFGVGGRLPFSPAFFSLSGLEVGFEAVPAPPAYNVEVESVLLSPAQSVVTVDVVLSLSTKLYYVARLAMSGVEALKKVRMQTLDKSAPGYQRLKIRAQLPLSDKPNACVEAFKLAVEGPAEASGPDGAGPREAAAACRVLLRQLQVGLCALPLDVQLMRTFANVPLAGGVGLLWQDGGRKVMHSLQLLSPKTMAKRVGDRALRSMVRAMMENALPEYIRENPDVDVLSVLQDAYALTRSGQGKRKASAVEEFIGLRRR
jgi:hypothetical protein